MWQRLWNRVNAEGNYLKGIVLRVWSLCGIFSVFFNEFKDFLNITHTALYFFQSIRNQRAVMVCHLLIKGPLHAETSG